MYPKFLSTIFLAVLSNSYASAGYILNGSFEASAGYFQTQQGVMPPNWVATKQSPDLYSTNGSFGLAPSDYGNFTGASAQDGLGWVAGWSLVEETFAQNLATTLTPGAEYSISGYLLQSKRPDLDNPGGYSILLNSTNSFSGPLVQVATWQPTTNSDSWEYRNATFTAPTNANSLNWIIFRPYDSGSGSAYPGLDNVSLTAGPGVSLNAVPEPSSCLFVATSMITFVYVRRRSNRRTMR